MTRSVVWHAQGIMNTAHCNSYSSHYGGFLSKPEKKKKRNYPHGNNNCHGRGRGKQILFQPPKKSQICTKVGFMCELNSRFSEPVNKTQQQLPSMGTFYCSIAGCDPLITNLPFHCVNVGLATHQDTLSIKCVLRHGRDAVWSSAWVPIAHYSGPGRLYGFSANMQSKTPLYSSRLCSYRV